MSRRYVKHSKINDLDQVIPEIVAVVSTKDNIQSVNDEQTYFKRNYLDALKKIIPSFYFADEQALSGTHISYTNQLLNSHILANKHQSTILPVSALQYDTYLSSIDTPSAFAPYFYKQRTPAQIASDDFERNILFPLGKSFRDFGTSEAFASYISGTFLPSIPMVCAGHHDTDDLATLTASSYANDSSGTYRYLTNNLGWVYFLNRTGPDDSGGITGFDPSSQLTDLMTQSVWNGRPIALEDTLGIYQEYLWKNQPIWGLSDRIIPVDYVSSVETSTGTWTSGTQVVDRLKTLTSIVYSPHFLDSTDNKVQTSFDTFFTTSSTTYEGTLITDTQEAGPLTRFLEAMSFEFADRVTEQAELNVLYDIGKCPEEFLELLGELIGWKFIGADYDKWRVQLRNAVLIYKSKGTRNSIQYLLDTLFSTGVFNVTTSNTFSELWESYIPDLIYYSLATSSEAFQSLETYTPEVARQFGVAWYDHVSLDRNIKYLVDKIIFDLVREFPQEFYLGGKPFPTPHLLLDGIPYIGPYNIIDFAPLPGEYAFPKFLTGSVSSAESEELTLDYDPNFLFNYRDRVYLVPPYEKRQYYTNTSVGINMLERIEYYLKCYGVDKSFAKQVVVYMRDNLNRSTDTNKAFNNFMLFTKEKTYPPNYAVILKDVSNNKTPDPVTLLSLWNGKSSHFFMNFEASAFNWGSNAFSAYTKYGLTKVMRVLEQVIPAHAIPNVILSMSSVSDDASALGDNDCREWRPNFNDLYEGSSTVTTGFGVCAVDMAAMAADRGLTPNRFTRTQVDNINDFLLSGNTFQARGSVDRNSLRRRNYRNLLPETKMFTRSGRNNPGSLELSTTYYSSALGYLPLGFMPSSLRFKEVALKQNESGYQIGQLLDTLDPVWEICQNLSSPSSIFGYYVSNTFASRAKQNVATSDCNTYGRRGQLPEIMYVMNKIHDKEKYLQASSIVSGYFSDASGGMINREWPVSSNLLQPVNFSAWYAEDSVYGGLDVPKSMGNYLINQEAADKSLNYYENFTFGRKVQELFNTYNSTFAGHAMNSNYDLIGGPNLFTHTYGPLVYNSNFDINGSALEVSGWLSASSAAQAVEISYYGGSGVLSISGMNGKGNHDLGTSAASDSGDLPLGKPEFRNKHLVSAIELVDTSSPLSNSPGPIFSIYKFSRDDQSKYSYAKYLINNQIIKYHRSTSTNLFPRLRLKIDNSDSTNTARNFLEPNHEYEVTINAHNLDTINSQIGGLTLGFWIHTEPENDQVWSYVPRGVHDQCGKYVDTWEAINVSDLSATGGIRLASGKAQTKAFTVGRLNNEVKKGDSSFGGALGDAGQEIDYDFRCWNPIKESLTPHNPSPPITNVGPRTLDIITFKFSTNNNKTFTRTPQYVAQYGEVHRLNQKYTLEFFVMRGSNRKFVVFEDIAIKDVTDYNKAVIQTKYGDAQLDVKDLKAVFRFFKDLSTGLASRNATITSGTMEVSGGSRLNYRSNAEMYALTEDGSTKQIRTLEIDEG